MKKLLLIACLLLNQAVTYAQSLNRPTHTIGSTPVIISGYIKSLKDGSKVYIVSADRDYWHDSSIVKNGHFKFRMDKYAGRSASLRLTRESLPGKWLDFYIDKGVINIEGNKNDIGDLHITGSPYAQDYYSYYSMLKLHKYFHDMYPIEVESINSMASNDTLEGERVYLKFRKMDSVKCILDKKWIVAHKNSPISSYIMYVDLWRNISRDELGAMLNALTPKAKDNVESKELEQLVYVYKHLRPGLPAMDFTQTDTSGKQVSLKDFKGKYVLLNFWASWCEPCREENPALVKIFNKYSNKGFTILSISLDNNRNSWIKAINTDRLNWTHVSDLKQWSNEVSSKYAVNSIPHSILISPNGLIVADNMDTEDLEKKLAEIFKQ